MTAAEASAGQVTVKGSNSDQFPGRLKLVVDKVRGPAALARSCSFSESVVRKWLRGTSEPTVSDLLEIAAAGDVPVEWLAAGKGSIHPETYQISDQAADYGDVAFALVPQYDVEVSAGAGKLVTREAEIGRLAFRRDWLRQKGLEPRNLLVVRVSGDSMEPTIRDGSLLLVDSTQEKLGEDGIYVLIVDGHLAAKRLQRDLAGSGVYIRSDNPAYREQYLTPGQAEHLFIVGRAVWAGGEI